MSSLPPLAGEAAVVVTDDGRLQAEITAAGLGMEALDGDAFAMRLWTASPDGVDRVVRDLVAKRRRRPVTPPRWRPNSPPTSRR